MALVARQQLGHYEIVALLGAGATSEVYRARDTHLGRDVALKLITHQFGPDAGAVDRFRREAQAASALNHPNIITIYEIGDAPEGRFIVMELVDGRTLRQLFGKLSVDAIPRVGVQMARALAVAHAAGILHRDIKPENIMVRPDGYVKVLDFGLARLADDTATITGGTTAHTEARTLLGTLRYMSPEQARGEPIGCAADIFALGLVFYELSTAQHPFEAGSPLAVLHGITSQSPVPPSRVNPAISNRLDNLILSMLERDERLRPTAAEIASELADLERDHPSRALFATSVAVRRESVGRSRERAELRAGLELVSSGRGLMICVAGEPGIGKTTLVEDFLAELATADRRCRIARGRCSERLAGAEAYLPFLEALDGLLRGDQASSIARLVKALAPTWYAQLTSLAGDEESDAGHISGVKAASPERFKRELATLLQEVSRLQTTILFFDDVHWADVSTVDLLSYLTTRFDSLRILVIATYRPSDLLLSEHPFLPLRLELQARGLCREVLLPFLEQQDVDSYLALEFPKHRFPRDLSALIHRKTEGNPLFMVDVIRELRAHGVLAQHGEHWTVAQSMPSIERDMPASIRSLIQRTIDRLDEDNRRLLAAASVQGYDFDAAVIARALERDAADVEERLDFLDRAHGLIRSTGEKELPDGTLTIAYRFVHVLYQNALYGSLRPARRASLSKAVAHALLASYGDKAAGIAAELAILFEAARDLPAATDYLLIATQNAVRIFAGEEALVLARRGLQLLDRPPELPDRARRELNFQILLGIALTIRKGYTDPEIEAAHSRARVLCLQIGATSELFRALYGLYTYFVIRANFASALETLDQLLDLAETRQDPTLLLIAHVGYAAPLVHTGDFDGALRHLEASLRVYEPVAYNAHPQLEIYGADPRTTMLIWFGMVFWFLGQPDRALERMHESLTVARERGQPFTLTYVLFLMAWLHVYRREAEAAQRYAEDAIALSQEHGFGQWLPVATIYRGWALAERGHADDVVPGMKSALAAYQAGGGGINMTHFYAVTAEACARAGADQDALRIVTEALDLARSTGERCWEADLERLHGELLLRQPGHEVEAEQCLQRAVDVAQGFGARTLELRATTTLARLYNRQGRKALGRSVLTEAYSWFTEGFETPDLEDARQMLEQL